MPSGLNQIDALRPKWTSENGRFSLRKTRAPNPLGARWAAPQGVQRHLNLAFCTQQTQQDLHTLMLVRRRRDLYDEIAKRTVDDLDLLADHRSGRRARLSRQAFALAGRAQSVNHTGRNAHRNLVVREQTVDAIGAPHLRPRIPVDVE